jgi:hypothetical protein
MKRLDGLWPQVVAFDNLWLGWRKARRGKSRSAGAVAFELDLERNLLTLQRDLTSGAYRPGAYRLFTIYERKPRLIAAAPFPDRVVQRRPCERRLTCVMSMIWCCWMMTNRGCWPGGTGLPSGWRRYG